MSVSPDAIRAHLDYSRWASARLLDAARQLNPEELVRDFGTADKSVLGTLVHVFGADRVWLSRVRDGHPGERPGADFEKLDVVASAWAQLHEEWRDWAGPLDDRRLAEVLSYRDLRGNPWQNELWKILLHVVNHATHHRGQVAGFLRTMGHTPPPLDLIAYYRGV